jgi:hypothetical protein
VIKFGCPNRRELLRQLSNDILNKDIYKENFVDFNVPYASCITHHAVKTPELSLNFRSDLWKPEHDAPDIPEFNYWNTSVFVLSLHASSMRLDET